MAEKLLTINEATEYGFSRSSIYRLAEQGELHILKIGRASRIAESDLIAFIERLKKSAANEG